MVLLLASRFPLPASFILQALRTEFAMNASTSIKAGNQLSRNFCLSPSPIGIFLPLLPAHGSLFTTTC